MCVCCCDRDAVSDLALHFLAKMKIMVIKDIEREDIEFICKVCLYHTPVVWCTGFTRLLESPGRNLQPWKVLRNDILVPESPGNLSLKVLEFAGTRTQWCGCGCKTIYTRTPLVLRVLENSFGVLEKFWARQWEPCIKSFRAWLGLWVLKFLAEISGILILICLEIC